MIVLRSASASVFSGPPSPVTETKASSFLVVVHEYEGWYLAGQLGAPQSEPGGARAASCMGECLLSSIERAPALQSGAYPSQAPIPSLPWL